jgi:hypothetical protein
MRADSFLFFLGEKLGREARQHDISHASVICKRLNPCPAALRPSQEGKNRKSNSLKPEAKKGNGMMDEHVQKIQRR